MGLIEQAIKSISSDQVREQNLLNEHPDIIYVDIEEVQPDSTQPRKKFDQTELTQLSETIKEHGVLQPVMVKVNPSQWRRDIDKYIIVFGERRYRAALLAGVKKIPIRVVDVSAKMALQLQTIENVQRADLTPAEEAGAYIRMQDEHNMGAREIARLVRKDHSNISKMIRVFRDDSLSVAVDSGSLPLYIAAALLPLPKDVRSQWARNITRRRNRGEELTPESVAAEVRLALGKPERKKAERPSVVNYHTPEPTSTEPETKATPASATVELFPEESRETTEQGSTSARPVELNGHESPSKQEIRQRIALLAQELRDDVTATLEQIQEKNDPADEAKMEILSALRDIVDTVKTALEAIE